MEAKAKYGSQCNESKDELSWQFSFLFATAGFLFQFYLCRRAFKTEDDERGSYQASQSYLQKN